MTQRGTLVLVVGPSGVGKDSIIAGAAAYLRGEDRVIFARRLITRPSDAGGEDHIALSPSAFAELRETGRLLLHWQAHGLEYGLPQELAMALDAGQCVVANVSRSVVGEARRRLAPVAVVAVTASSATLAARLAARGRETVAEIDRRLERPGALSPDEADFIINNNGSLAAAIDRFIALLRRTIGQPANG